MNNLMHLTKSRKMNIGDCIVNRLGRSSRNGESHTGLKLHTEAVEQALNRAVQFLCLSSLQKIHSTSARISAYCVYAMSRNLSKNQAGADYVMLLIICNIKAGR